MAFRGDFGDRVLCAVDLEHSWHAVTSQAAQFAALSGATLEVIHVIEPPGHAISRLFESKDATERLERHCRELRDKLLVEVRRHIAQDHPVPVEATVCSGPAAARILEAAKSGGAGLIVVGTRDWEGWSRLFVGSTADRILRNAEVPVLVASPHLSKPIKRILVPTDLDRADIGAVRVASRLASKVKARVSLLHVYAQPSMHHRYMGDLSKLRKAARTTAKERFEQYVAELDRTEGAKVAHKLLKSSTDEERPADQIIETCDKLSIDLIVMALGGISLLQSVVIGAVAERLIRDLPCPFLALPTAWAEERARRS